MKTHYFSTFWACLGIPGHAHPKHDNQFAALIIFERDELCEAKIEILCKLINENVSVVLFINLHDSTFKSLFRYWKFVISAHFGHAWEWLATPTTWCHLIRLKDHDQFLATTDSILHAKIQADISYGSHFWLQTYWQWWNLKGGGPI